MAMFNPYPATYQNPYYNMVQQPVVQGQNSVVQNQQPVVQNNSPIIWVQGEAGAKSYLVAPNTTVQLWDSENQIIYLKSADASGMPSIKVIDYKVRGSESVVPQGQTADFVSRSEFTEQIEKLRKEIRSMSEEKEG